MKVEYYTVTVEHHGQRIDNFLITRCKGVPKSRIYRAIRGGEVRVNKGRVSNEYRIQTGDAIRVPPLRKSTEIRHQPSANLQQLLESRILYEDESLLILNKPAGIPVHGGTENSIGAIEALRVLRPHQKFLELAHRLDKGTSGCLVLAKKRSMLLTLHDLFKKPKGIQKKYLAIVKGHWPKEITRIDAPLLKQEDEKGSHFVKVSRKSGKKAETLFRPMRYLKKMTLLEATLLTGRTHQIRVHTAITGYPVVGDEKYGDFAFNRSVRNVHRLYLHAASIVLSLPDATKPLAIEAPLDKDFSLMLDENSL